MTTIVRDDEREDVAVFTVHFALSVNVEIDAALVPDDFEVGAPKHLHSWPQALYDALAQAALEQINSTRGPIEADDINEIDYLDDYSI